MANYKTLPETGEDVLPTTAKSKKSYGRVALVVVAALTAVVGFSHLRLSSRGTTTLAAAARPDAAGEGIFISKESLMACGPTLDPCADGGNCLAAYGGCLSDAAGVTVVPPDGGCPRWCSWLC